MIALPTISPPSLRASDVLARVVTLLARESAWTQGAYARDALGRHRDPLDSRAASWCLIGALRRCAGSTWEDESSPYYKALTALARACGTSDPWVSDVRYASGTVSRFSDAASHTSVLAVCRQARDAAVIQEGGRP